MVYAMYQRSMLKIQIGKKFFKYILLKLYLFCRVGSITIPREKCCVGFQFVGDKCVKIRSDSICSCPSGYQSNADSEFCKCEPVCDNICENGQCVAPNVCQCNEGYERDDEFGVCRGKCKCTSTSTFFIKTATLGWSVKV